MPSRHPSLRHEPSDLIGGGWRPISGEGGQKGTEVASRNPARPSEVVWSGRPEPGHVEEAVRAARAALPAWARTARETRFAVLRRFAQLCKERSGALAELICDETGKAMWDAKAEAGLLAAKVDITLDASPEGALRRVSDFEVGLSPSRVGRCWFRPHGVMAVIGPFNFPAHLPNGHIVPALAMGNTVVLKPSDKAPGVGQMLGELLQEAFEGEGAPAGVVNVVQGGAGIAAALVGHAGVDGVLFTGSWPVGRAILKANLDTPGRIVALEMGGNNPAVVLADADLRQAAVECVRSAFVTTGQRCTCTRRVIVHESVAERFIGAVCKAASELIVGDPRGGGVEGGATGPVFMGPIISEASRRAVLGSQAAMAEAGGEVLLRAGEGTGIGPGWYLTPGVVRVERFVVDKGSDRSTGEGSDATALGLDAGCDVEVFGPLLRVSVVRGLDDAVEQANATRFGLAASIFTRDQTAAERFLFEVRAGCVNVNTGTAGASSKLPFGGLGRSGNHRPAGAFSLDYCAYPVAGMIETGGAATVAEGMKFEDDWLR